MSYAKGYYSIIQYCPDPSRLEAVNIGVALFCPELRFLGAKFKGRKTKVSQLFGKQDWKFVELQQTAIMERLVREHEAFQTLDNFQAYISRRANALVMTNPRPVKVQNPSQDLESLLFRLVASPAARTARAVPISKELGSVLQDAGVVSRLQRNVTVNPPSLPRPLKVPFAYRNGRLNLIEPVGFEGQTAEKVFRTASVKAVEGEFIGDFRDPDLGELSLVVVAKFGPEQERERQTAATVFNRHQVPMHEFGKLDALIEDIRQHAH